MAMDAAKIIMNGIQVAWLYLCTLDSDGKIDSISTGNKIYLKALSDCKIALPAPPAAAATAGNLEIKTNSNISYAVAKSLKTIDLLTGDEVAGGTTTATTIFTLVTQECDSVTILKIQEHTGPILTVVGYGKDATGAVDSYFAGIGRRTSALEINPKQETAMTVSLTIQCQKETASSAGATALAFTPTPIVPDGDISYAPPAIASGDVTDMLAGKYVKLT